MDSQGFDSLFSASENMMPIIISVLVAIVIGLVLQFLPTIIANSKKSSNRGQVMMLNFLVFGVGIFNWFIFGWLLPVSIVSILISIGLFVFWLIALTKAIKG